MNIHPDITTELKDISLNDIDPEVLVCISILLTPNELTELDRMDNLSTMLQRQTT